MIAMTRCLLAILLLPCLLHAQAVDTSGFIMDTTIVQATDSLSVPDTLFHMTTPSVVGTLDQWLDSSHVISRHQLPWLEYRYLGDILGHLPGVFVADQQSEGQYSRLSVRGSDWRSIAVMADGRPLNDPGSGIYNLFGFSTEYADRIELISGPRAFVYGLNGTGGTVNLLTRNFNTNRPLSCIAYSQSAYSYSRSDGFFSQNVSRRVNVTFGFQAQGTDGRFPNAVSEQWNSRLKIRYNPLRELNIIASHYFTSTQTELNGGVNLAASGTVDAFIPPLATMVNTDSYEKLTRNDVDLSLVGTFLGDTTSISTLTLYYSHQLREYRDEENRPSPNGIFLQSDHTSSWMGVLMKQTIATEWQRFHAGGSVELRQIEGSPNIGRRRNVIGSVWAVEEILPGDRVRVAGFGRLDRYLHSSYGGWGSDASVSILPWLTVSAGFSLSRRVPTYQELYWTGDGVSRSGEIRAERHRVGEMSVALRPDSSFLLKLTFFHRSIDDPILVLPVSGSTVFPGFEFINGGTISTNGIEAGVRTGIWVLTLEGAGTLLLQEDEGGIHLRDYPRFSGSGGIYYWNTLLSGKLNLKVGFRGRYLSAHAGSLFNPEVSTYVPNTGSELGQGSAIDFQLLARIDDAAIHFIWSNLTSATHFTTPFYPVRDREIRFGVVWQFLD